jgi:hypothetical protein
MVKIYYTIQYGYTVHRCCYELQDYTLGKDHRTLYYKDCLAFTIETILPELLYHKYHITVDKTCIIDGKKVEYISDVSFA